MLHIYTLNATICLYMELLAMGLVAAQHTVHDGGNIAQFTCTNLQNVLNYVHEDERFGGVVRTCIM